MKQPKPGWVQMEMKSSGSRYLQLLKLIYNCEDHFLFYELLLITRGCIFFFQSRAFSATHAKRPGPASVMTYLNSTLPTANHQTTRALQQNSQ